MTDLSARLALPLIQAAQAQKHVTHNEALERLDVLVQLAVEAFDATTPPGSPAEGQVWALGAAPTGAWAGHGGELAAWSNGGWLFVTPQAGWRAASGTTLRIHDGSAWVAPDAQNLPGLGINTTWDTTNRLAVASAAALFTHDGAGHQLKIDKAAAGDTASLLFQTGFSGRAELGTAGSDDFSLKVSPDGSTWHTALTAARSTGAVTLGQPLALGSGGTGATTAAAARSNLGLGTAATLNHATAVTDITTGRVPRIGDYVLSPPANILPDAGTFMGLRRHSQRSDNLATFDPGLLLPYNGATFSDGGAFIHDNSTYGGAGAALNADVDALLVAMGRNTSALGRFGTTFRLLTITAGTGTLLPTVGQDSVTRYLCCNTNGLLTGLSNALTWSYWVRVASGSAHLRYPSNVGGVDRTGGFVLSSAWQRVFCVRTQAIGYESHIGLDAEPGSVIQIALFAVFSGVVAPFNYTAPLYGNWTYQNILGTVSQSAGVPTGALFQRGSNSNGEFVRLADGTQICTHNASASLAIDTAFMGGFRSAAQTWTYPAAFVAAPSVAVLARNLTAFGAIGANTPTASSMQWAVTSVLTQTAATRDVALTAIGRWF